MWNRIADSVGRADVRRVAMDAALVAAFLLTTSILIR